MNFDKYKDYPLLGAAVEVYLKDFKRVEIAVWAASYYTYVIDHMVVYIYDTDANMIKSFLVDKV